MVKYAGCIRTRALSGAETIQCQWGSAGIPNTGEPAWLLCRTCATMPYIWHNAVCRMKHAVREHASSLLSLPLPHSLIDKKKKVINLKKCDMNFPLFSKLVDVTDKVHSKSR